MKIICCELGFSYHIWFSYACPVTLHQPVGFVCFCLSLHGKAAWKICLISSVCRKCGFRRKPEFVSSFSYCHNFFHKEVVSWRTSLLTIKSPAFYNSSFYIFSYTTQILFLLLRQSSPEEDLNLYVNSLF